MPTLHGQRGAPLPALPRAGRVSTKNACMRRFGADRRARTCSRASGAPPGSSGRRQGVLLLPGLGNSAGDYGGLKTKLEERGFVVEVAPVQRIDWLRNAAGLKDSRYWRGTLQPRPTVDW